MPLFSGLIAAWRTLTAGAVQPENPRYPPRLETSPELSPRWSQRSLFCDHVSMVLLNLHLCTKQAPGSVSGLRVDLLEVHNTYNAKPGC